MITERFRNATHHKRFPFDKIVAKYVAITQDLAVAPPAFRKQLKPYCIFFASPQVLAESRCVALRCGIPNDGDRA